MWSTQRVDIQTQRIAGTCEADKKQLNEPVILDKPYHLSDKALRTACTFFLNRTAINQYCKRGNDMFSSDDIDSFTCEVSFEKEAIEKKPLEDLFGKLTLSSLKMKRFSGISTFSEKLGEIIPTVEFRHRERREDYYIALRVHENKIELIIRKPPEGLVIGREEPTKELLKKPFSEDYLRELSQDLDFVVGVFIGFMRSGRPLKSRVELTASRKSELITLDHLYRDEYLKKVKDFAANPRLTGVQVTSEETVSDGKRFRQWNIYHEEGKMEVQAVFEMEGAPAIDLSEVIKDGIDKVNSLIKISYGE